MKKYLFYNLAIVLLLSSCQKEKNSDKKNSSSSTNISMKEAKEWFVGSVIINKNNENLKAVSKSNPPYTVNWNAFTVSEDEQFSTIEFPIELERSTGYLTRNATKQNGKKINSLVKLLFLKDKKTGTLQSSLMSFHSYNDLNIEASTYKNPVKNFSGIIFFSSLNLAFINGWEYNEGKLISKLSAQKQTGTARMSDPTQCDTYYIDTYERICVDNYCSEWTLVNTTQVSSCPNSGSGGYSPPSCSSVPSATEILNSGSIVSESLASVAGEYRTDPATNIEYRTQSEKWKFYTGDVGWGTFDCISWDKGLQKKNGTSWEWLNLEHQSHGIVNNASMIEPSILNMTTNSSISTDKKIARMNLDFIVGVKVVCLGIETSTASKNLIASKAFTVK